MKILFPLHPCHSPATLKLRVSTRRNELCINYSLFVYIAAPSRRCRSSVLCTLRPLWYRGSGSSSRNFCHTELCCCCRWLFCCWCDYCLTVVVNFAWGCRRPTCSGSGAAGSDSRGSRGSALRSRLAPDAYARPVNPHTSAVIQLVWRIIIITLKLYNCTLESISLMSRRRSLIMSWLYIATALCAWLDLYDLVQKLQGNIAKTFSLNTVLTQT